MPALSPVDVLIVGSGVAGLSLALRLPLDEQGIDPERLEAERALKLLAEPIGERPGIPEMAQGIRVLQTLAGGPTGQFERGHGLRPVHRPGLPGLGRGPQGETFGLDKILGDEGGAGAIERRRGRRQ